MEKTLYKSTKNKIIDGVCGGIGEYFSVDPTLIRLGFVLLCACGGGGLVLYIVALIIMPRAPEGYDPSTVHNRPTGDTSRSTAGSPSGSDTAKSGGASTEPSSDHDTPTMI